MGNVRQPAAYGFYPPGKEALEASVRQCFLDSHGPGHIPTINAQRQGQVIGGVTPHAGFIYSGPIASHLYSVLAEDGFPETFVIIGPKHGYMRFEGAAIMSKGAWETPLGKTPIDNELSQILLEIDQATEKPLIIESEEAHQGEHSLEVQLPFLQFLAEDSSLRIVPLVISAPSYVVCERVGKLIAKAITQAGRDVIFLASTDFTHYGKHYYNYAPVGSGPVDKIVNWVHQTDGDLIKKIEQMDGKALLDTVIQEKRTMCGASAVATMIVAAQELGATSGELLKYATSYDVRGSADAIVGYASIVIRR